MIKDQTPVRVLRPRKKSAADSKTSQPTIVRQVTVAIRRGNTTTKHEIVFDNEPLSLKEMYSVGFIGDLEFRHPSGILEKGEVEAGPKGEFEGDEIGRFVFRVKMLDAGSPQDAHVVKFNFMTRS